MATGEYIGVNGVARKVVSPYVGVEGVARNVVSGYVGVDGVARLFFAFGGDKVILEVKKVTSDTYANNTTYSAEEFILLDIYPKTGGTVNVTYGGLTKTITDTSGAEVPSSQQVFFGTFNGVTDSVSTPSSGELIIDGDYRAVGQGGWKTNKNDISIGGKIPCVTAIRSLGEVEVIPFYAFANCTSLTSVTIPPSVTSIEGVAFQYCTSLTNVTIPASVTAIIATAFSTCTSLTHFEVDSGNTNFSSDGCILYNKNKTEICCYPTVPGHYTIPSSITSIGFSAFCGCKSLTSLTIPASVTSIGMYAFTDCTSLTSITIFATTPPTVDTNLGSNISLTRITVPKGSGDTYKAAEGWNAFTDVIVEEA